MREMTKHHPNSMFKRMLRASALRCLQRISTKACSLRFRRHASRASLSPLLTILLGAALAMVPRSSWGYCSGGVPPPNPHGGQRPAGGTLRGVTTATNPQGQPLSIGGVQIKLAGAAPKSAPLSTFSDNTATYVFVELQPGTYTLEASLEGFKSVVKTVTIPVGQTVVQNIRLELEEVHQQVEVRQSAPTVSAQSSAPPDTIIVPEFRALPGPQTQFKNVLPLVRGVAWAFNYGSAVGY